MLGQRAEVAYDYARPIIDADCDRAGDPARYRRFIREVGAVLAEAAGEDVPGDDTSDWIREAVMPLDLYDERAWRDLIRPAWRG